MSNYSQFSHFAGLSLCFFSDWFANEWSFVDVLLENDCMLWNSFLEIEKEMWNGKELILVDHGMHFCGTWTLCAQVMVLRKLEMSGLFISTASVLWPISHLSISDCVSSLFLILSFAFAFAFWLTYPICYNDQINFSSLELYSVLVHTILLSSRTIMVVSFFLFLFPSSRPVAIQEPGINYEHHNLYLFYFCLGWFEAVLGVHLFSGE